MEDYKEYIGRKVIIHGRPLGDMTGYIEDVVTDPHGDVELLGTWGWFTLFIQDSTISKSQMNQASNHLSTQMISTEIK